MGKSKDNKKVKAHDTKNAQPNEKPKEKKSRNKMVNNSAESMSKESAILQQSSISTVSIDVLVGDSSSAKAAYNPDVKIKQSNILSSKYHIQLYVPLQDILFILF